MGGIYKNTSHLYFCHVIKKKLKKHYLVYDLVKKWEDSGLLDDITGLIPDTNIFPVSTVGGTLTMDEDQHLDLIGRQERPFLDVGTVIWNQELHRLEFWDGYMWQHLVTNNV